MRRRRRRCIGRRECWRGEEVKSTGGASASAKSLPRLACAAAAPVSSPASRKCRVCLVRTQCEYLAAANRGSASGQVLLGVLTSTICPWR
jgi:hypothetical protein